MSVTMTKVEHSYKSTHRDPVQKPLGTLLQRELACSLGLLQAYTWKAMKSKDLEEESNSSHM